MSRILYLEDDPALHRMVRAIVEREGYRVDIASTGRQFREILGEPPDLFLLDLQLPDTSGLEILRMVREAHPGVPAIMVTASENIADVVQAMKLGALDYIAKPFEPQRLVVSIRNALQHADQRREIEQLRRDVMEPYGPQHLVGTSPAMAAVRALIAKAAPSDATVLITGESGTGKELVARALHVSGPRRQGPFVDVNCAALTESLLESELFGHEKGAFTGALTRRRGKFEQAHGGTIFLDEIGDTPLPTQAKMLRVLQECAFQRVGGEERIDVDVRVVCATNRNLEEDKTFRRDLFYRINTMVLELPPLRARAQDIPELARHFLARACRRQKKTVSAISQAALEAICRHAWPGNVRELEHSIDRAVLVSEGDEILPEHLPRALTREAAPPEGAGGLVEAVERLERSMILAALEKHGWVKSKAARDLGITERVISYKMDGLGLNRPPA